MSEIREDIITGNNVVIAANRGKRPHDFKHDNQLENSQDRHCPFCYGNELDTPCEILAVSDDPTRRANQEGWKIRVVPNKFAALDREGGLDKLKDGLYTKMAGVGAAEVVIETNEHNTTLGELSLDHIKELINVLKSRYQQLAKDEKLKYIQIFKNFGGTAGASLEHPHWQVMATPLVPNVIKDELKGAEDFYQKQGSCVYCQILKEELEIKERVIMAETDFVAFSPYAARFPYETWILPRKHQSSFAQITTVQIENLAKILKEMVRKLEVGLNYAPFNIVLHTAPVIEENKLSYHWHLEIIPRLSITAGFELGTGAFINITPPEIAAQRLREIKI